MATQANNACGVPEDGIPGDASPGRASLRGIARRLHRVRWLPLVVAGALGVGVSLPVGATNLHKPSLSEGLVCTNGNATTDAQGIEHRSYVLTARDGYISTNDGNSIYMWSFAEGDKDFQYPGPFLCANQGDQVTVTLHNSLKVATSIVFTGVAGVKSDGVASQPDGGLTGPTTGLTQPAAPGSGTTYTFTAGQPGTFLYESGTDSQMQVQMGMEGGLIVRPFDPTAACGSVATPVSCKYDPGRLTNFAYNTPFSEFNTSKEFVHLFSEVDPDLHHTIELRQQSAVAAVNADTSYDWAAYNSRYFMINGRSFPDDLSPNGTSNQPTQPYGAMVHLMPRCDSTTTPTCYPTGPTSMDYNPSPVLVRYLNAGPGAIAFHAHGNHESTVGTDGHESVIPIGPACPVATPPATTFCDASVERFDVNVPPGGTVDTQFTWVDAQQWSAPTATSPGNPIKVPEPNQQDRLEGPFWNGSPYLGNQQPFSTGVTRYNECGEFYHFAHDHDLIHITSFGISGGGGQLTLVRVDPPPSMQKAFGVTCSVPGK